MTKSPSKNCVDDAFIEFVNSTIKMVVMGACASDVCPACAATTIGYVLSKNLRAITDSDYTEVQIIEDVMKGVSTALGVDMTVEEKEISEAD